MAAGRIEIGFAGGQVVAVKLDEAKFKELRKSLDKADGWADVETEDGTIALDLRQVVFVRGAPGEHRIGFTSG
jgi:hypothetical protein